MSHPKIIYYCQYVLYPLAEYLYTQTQYSLREGINTAVKTSDFNFIWP